MKRLALLGLLLTASTARAASPVGEVRADCTVVDGWAQDPDNPGAAIAVHLYFDGPAGDPAATGIPLVADLVLQAGCAGDQCAHGFRAALPYSRFDGAPHPVHAYGIDGVDPNLELALSPTSYTCAPLPIVAGVKRHIAGPSILDQWKFSTYFDLMKVADLDLAAVPVGVVVDGPPQLVVAEGTTDPLWLLDQGFRRPVAPDVAAAWRLDPALATPMPADMLAALPEGTPLVGRPILVQGTGAEVYLLDEHQCGPGDDHPSCVDPVEPTTGSDASSGGSDSGDPSGDDSSAENSSQGETTAPNDSTGNGTTADGDSTDGASASATTGPDMSDRGTDDTGCACRSPAPPASSWLLLLVLATIRRRRS